MIEMTGKKFGRLTVLKKAEYKTKARQAHWWCRCECGNELIVNGSSLRRGLTKSCGCLRDEYRRKKKTPPRRAAQRIECNGELLTFSQASKVTGIVEYTLRRRYKHGARGKTLFRQSGYPSRKKRSQQNERCDIQ